MKSKFFYIIFTFIFLITLCSCKPDTGSHSISYNIDQTIDSITINWGVGNITFIQSDTFKLEEIAKEESEIITTPLSYEISDCHLTINHEYDTLTQNNKHLNIYCNLNNPLKSLNITSDFGILRLNDQHIDQLNVETNSGQFFIKNCIITNAFIFMPYAAYSSIEHSVFNTLEIRSEKVDSLAMHLIYNKMENCNLVINDGITNIFYNNCKNMKIQQRYGKTIFRLRTVDCDWGYIYKVNISNMEHYHNEISFIEIENDSNYENIYQYKNPNGNGLNTIEINTEGEIHVWN